MQASYIFQCIIQSILDMLRTNNSTRMQDVVVIIVMFEINKTNSALNNNINNIEFCIYIKRVKIYCGPVINY